MNNLCDCEKRWTWDEEIVPTPEQIAEVSLECLIDIDISFNNGALWAMRKMNEQIDICCNGSVQYLITGLSYKLRERQKNNHKAIQLVRRKIKE